MVSQTHLESNEVIRDLLAMSWVDLDTIYQTREAAAEALSDIDRRLELFGVLIGDSEHLDPEMWEGKPHIEGLWLLGQLRNYAHMETEGVDMIPLIHAWLAMARKVFTHE